MLRDVPRTSEVRARTPLELYALKREVFVPAVSGYRPAEGAAEAVISRRLEGPDG